MSAPLTENPAPIAEVGMGGSEATHETDSTTRQEEYHRDDYGLKLSLYQLPSTVIGRYLKLGANGCQLHILEIVPSEP